MVSPTTYRIEVARPGVQSIAGGLSTEPAVGRSRPVVGSLSRPRRKTVPPETAGYCLGADQHALSGRCALLVRSRKGLPRC